MKLINKSYLIVFLILLSFTSVSSAQNNPGDLLINSAMAEAVNEAKESYVKGMNLDAFLNANGVAKTSLTKDELAVIKDVHTFLVNGTSSMSIINSYDGVSLKNAAKSNAFQNVSSNTQGKGCNFFCILRILKEIIIIILGGGF